MYTHGVSDNTEGTSRDGENYMGWRGGVVQYRGVNRKRDQAEVGCGMGLGWGGQSMEIITSSRITPHDVLSSAT